MGACYRHGHEGKKDGAFADSQGRPLGNLESCDGVSPGELAFEFKGNLWLVKRAYEVPRPRPLGQSALWLPPEEPPPPSVRWETVVALTLDGRVLEVEQK